MKLSSKSRLQLTIQKIIFLLLFVSCIGMLAWISNHYNYQLDLTANKRHSLSAGSVELLGLLNREITVHAYTSDEVTRKAVREIIERYQRVKADFRLKLLNPDIDLSQAQQDGIVMDKPFAFVIYYNGRMEHIDSLSEHAISNALLRLNRRDKQLTLFLSGHGERDINGSDNRAYSKLKQLLDEQGFNPGTLNLLENPIPGDTRLIVISTPVKNYHDGEIAQLETYLDNGGNMLWLADPGEMQGLEPLATALDLKLQPGIVVDNNPQLRETLNIQHPGIIPVTEYFPHTITNPVRYNTLFPLARGISPPDNTQPAHDWQQEALFNSVGNSWIEAAGLGEEMVFDSGTGDIAGPVTIAVALHRSAARGNEQSVSQRVVVVGDSDFLANAYIGAGANLELGLNIFNWLIGDDDFISIETRTSPDTKLELNNMHKSIIGIGFFLVIPAGLLITGFAIWYHRKKL